ncbi:putative glutamyl endopeptidase, chloroplastic, partial [Drosera capensis]
QSERFFSALKGHGALCRLVILPYESHGYTARESIMHVLWETDRWLQKYCVVNVGNVSDALQNSSKKDDSLDDEVVSATGGGGFEVDDQWQDLHSKKRSLL